MPTQKKGWSSSNIASPKKQKSKRKKGVFQERNNSEEVGKKYISDAQLRSLLVDFYCEPFPNGWERPNVGGFLKKNELGSKWQKFTDHWKDSGLNASKMNNVCCSSAFETYDLWKADKQSKIQARNKANARKPRFIIKEDPQDPRETLQTLNLKPITDKELVDDNPHSLPTPVVLFEVPTSVGAEEAAIDLLQHEEHSTGSSQNETGTKRASKLTEVEMQTLIMAYYSVPDSTNIIQFLTANRKKQNVGAFRSHWRNSGLSLLKKEGSTVLIARTTYDEWRSKERERRTEINTKNAQHNKVVPAMVASFLDALISTLASFGQGISRQILEKIISKVLREANYDDGKKNVYSRATVDRFLKKFDIVAKDLKAVDPARINQVSTLNRDALFNRLDNVVRLLNAVDLDGCPWTEWKKVPGTNIYNMDEAASDSTRHKNKCLVPSEGGQRLFQVTPEGDRMPRHITLAIFSRADGIYKDESNGIHGSPMPMVIHAGTKKNDGKSVREKRIKLYDQEPDDEIAIRELYTAGFNRKNPLGIAVRVTSNGSMTKEIFFDACIHFVRNLPPDHGKNGLWCFLLLDSHVSRWNPCGINYLFEHKVMPIYFPSHLSIVVQPQDNGVISFLQYCVANIWDEIRLFKTGTNIEFFNQGLEKALTEFREEERMKLRDRGSNSTTRAWGAKTGLFPRNPQCENWQDSLQTYGVLNALKIEPFGFHVAHVPLDLGTKLPPQEHIDLINTARVNLGHRGKPITSKISALDHFFTKCYQIVTKLIDDWLEKPQGERSTQPEAASEAQEVAIQYIPVKVATKVQPYEDVWDHKAVLSQVQASKRIALVTISVPNETIKVRRASATSDSWSTAVKIAPGQWQIHEDGQNIVQLDSDMLNGNEWTVNCAERASDMNFKGKDKARKAAFRRKKELDKKVEDVAVRLAEQLRLEKIKKLYEANVGANWESFQEHVLPMIDSPSVHEVHVEVGDELKTFTVSADGERAAVMDSLVLNTVATTIVGAIQEARTNTGRKKTKNRVVKTKRGSDGFVKKSQVDDQQLADLQAEEQETVAKQKKTAAKVESRLKKLSEFNKLMAAKERQAWDDHGKLVLKEAKRGRGTTPHPTGQELILMFAIFEISLPKPNNARARLDVLKSFGITFTQFRDRKFVLKKQYKRLTGDQYLDSDTEDDGSDDGFDDGSNGRSSDDDSSKDSVDFVDENDERSGEESELSEEDDD